MHILSCSIIIFLLSLVTFADAHAASYTSVSSKKQLDLAELVRSVEQADVIFIGEIHYEPKHHEAQLEIIRSLQARKPVAIGLEMFTPEDQPLLDDWSAGKLDEEKFKQICAQKWSYEWPLYRDLLVFAKDKHIPLVALNVPKPVIAKVVNGGRGALQESEVPPKIAWSLNPAQTEYMRVISRQVFGGSPPEKLLERLCQAQALRNNTMAWNIAKYRQKNAARRLVVLTGMWHAVKNGVPEQLAAHGEVAFQVILPELPELNLQNTTNREADYMILK